MGNSVIISTEVTKKTPVGCALFVARATPRNRTCMLFNTVEIYFIEHSRKSRLGESCWFGTTTNTHSSLEFLWECKITNSSEILVGGEALSVCSKNLVGEHHLSA